MGGGMAANAGDGATSMPIIAGGSGATPGSFGGVPSPGVVSSDSGAAMDPSLGGPVADGRAVADGNVAQPGVGASTLAGPVATSDGGQVDPGVVQTSSNIATPAVGVSGAPDQGGSLVGRLTLVNPRDAGGAINYALDGNAYTIEPDSVQDVTGQGPWVIAFDRGLDGAQARYSLTPGRYTFTLTDKGWELYNTAGAQVAGADSTDGQATGAGSADTTAKRRLLVVNPRDAGGAVNYTLDCNAYTIQPGSAQDVTTPGPWVVAFDRGVDGA
jgi:hypothetical protein